MQSTQPEMFNHDDEEFYFENESEGTISVEFDIGNDFFSIRKGEDSVSVCVRETSMYTDMVSFEVDHCWCFGASSDGQASLHSLQSELCQ